MFESVNAYVWDCLGFFEVPRQNTVVKIRFRFSMERITYSSVPSLLFFSIPLCI